MNPEWRALRGWSPAELRARLADLPGRKRNFVEDPDDLSARGPWGYYESQSHITTEAPGAPEPGGTFDRLKQAIHDYRFSDPSIVAGHFDRAAPLPGRYMLLELKPLFLHYICGVVVGAVRDETDADRSVWGYRYETLEGHLESGAEWFLLVKDHETGRITFSISAHWRRGEFPNWWSRLGFHVLGQHYQRQWHRHAHRRLTAVAISSHPREPALTPEDDR